MLDKHTIRLLLDRGDHPGTDGRARVIARVAGTLLFYAVIGNGVKIGEIADSLSPDEKEEVIKKLICTRASTVDSLIYSIGR